MNHSGEQHNRRPVVVSVTRISDAFCKSASTHSQPEHKLMPLVEHAEVQNNASKHAALTSSQQHATYDQCWVALDRAHTCAHNTPCQSKDGKVSAAADDLEQPIRGDVNQNV